MKFIYDDGGRNAAGFKGRAGDCVARAIAIASARDYAEVYKDLSALAGNERNSKGATARNGIRTGRKWFKDYMRANGFEWTATMAIGAGCTVHLHDGELPQGRLVVSVSKHLTAVIDGVIRDTHDPQRELHIMGPIPPGGKYNELLRISRRCVYGYWRLA